MASITPTHAALGGISRVLVFALAIFCSAMAIPDQNILKAAENEAAAEYDVKAAFLLNFTRFVEWPQLPPERASSSFSICILGDDPFGEALSRIVAGETVAGRPLVIKRIQRWPDACEVLYIPASHTSPAAVLAEVGQHVLTVGESSDFLRHGGMIRFVLENRRVRFDIDLRSVDRSGLKMSSRLLGVARTVIK